MYYDTRPSVFNGAFDYYTYRKLKGYYPLYWYGLMYDMAYEVKADNQHENVYSLCGVDAQGKATAIITYYSDDDQVRSQQLTVDFGRKSQWEVYLVDADHDGELLKVTDDPTFDLKVHSILLLKEK